MKSTSDNNSGSIIGKIQNLAHEQPEEIQIGMKSAFLRLMSEIMQYTCLSKFDMTLALMMFRWGKVRFDQFFWTLCYFYLGL